MAEEKVYFKDLEEVPRRLKFWAAYRGRDSEIPYNQYVVSYKSLLEVVRFAVDNNIMSEEEGRKVIMQSRELEDRVA